MRQKYSWFTIREILAVLTLAVMLAAPAVAVSKYKVLHEFKGKDGEYPYGDLIFDTTGNLYGTTYFGGANNGGTVFKLIPHVGGSWTESVLYSFCSLKTAPTDTSPQPALSLTLPETFMARPTSSEGSSNWRQTRMEPGRKACWHACSVPLREPT